MISEEAAKSIAEQYLRESQGAYDPPLGIDWDDVEVKEGILIAPYNSIEYLQTRDVRDQLLDCWPILVDMTTGNVRFGKLEERDFWRSSGE
ncbi:YrhB domain-containing protein [Streptomyces sp. NPDC048521]|uniref:YrhB domain-containing protein n=1 Tax=Streptomyces sp. NPDC048521 TaxID=3365566 RepID=UPI0037104A00